ncbi:MAG: hypothetical protein P8Z49_04345 [Acidobacteriota bacterium]|jgi:hypothetical protein
MKLSFKHLLVTASVLAFAAFSLSALARTQTMKKMGDMTIKGQISHMTLESGARKKTGDLGILTGNGRVFRLVMNKKDPALFKRAEKAADDTEYVRVSGPVIDKGGVYTMTVDHLSEHLF